MPGWFSTARTLHELPIWMRYGLTTLLVIATFMLRYLLVGDERAYHFIFFVPSILLSSLFLARGSGIWAVFLSTALVKLFFLKPTMTLGFARQEDLWAIIVFFTTGIVTALSSEALHNAFFRVAAANTELAAAYQRIAASEQEKDLLLHDLAHRFRNDLANLTAILRLQAGNIDDPLAKTEFMSASERVYIMGRVHQRLARYGEDAQVAIREFLTDLCADMRLAMIGSRPVTLRADIEPAQFPFGRAITVGLIVNELVTNALKYAFPNDRTGTITVSLKLHGEEYRLQVSDDGVGQAAPAPGSTGLGQRLVQAMAQQLGGHYETAVREGGRICLVRFPSAA